MKIRRRSLIGLFFLLAVLVQAQITIDRRITIQPIRVATTNFSYTSNPGLILYEAETDKIFSQAGIDVLFLPWQVYNNDLYMDLSSSALNSDSLNDLSQVPLQPWSDGGSLGLANTVVKLFFVQTIDNTPGKLGFTLQSSFVIDEALEFSITQERAVAIADSAFTIGPQGRIDVIAHELGHALALYHGDEGVVPTLGAGGPLNFMSSPRTSPSYISDIYPDGVDADQLTGTIGGTNWGNDAYFEGGFIEGDQIDRMRRMPISVVGTYPSYNPIPEPATTTAIAGSIMLALAGVIRRRRATKKVE